MKTGFEDKKKLAAAIGLSLVAAVTVYTQFFDSAPPAGGRPAASSRAAVKSAIPAQPSPPRTPSQQAAQRTLQRRAQVRGQNFQPVWQRSQDDVAFDPLEADPSLRTGLLAAVRRVGFEGVQRNIFEFTDRRRIESGPTQEEIASAQRLQEQFARKPEPAAPAPSAPAGSRVPRLDWKYYGFAHQPGGSKRRAFLLDGEEVLIGGEGDIFRSRYKIIRIGLNSIVIEDMEYKAEQTLALEAPAG